MIRDRLIGIPLPSFLSLLHILPILSIRNHSFHKTTHLPVVKASNAGSVGQNPHPLLYLILQPH